MDQRPKKFFSSKVSIIGLFATLTIILTIPLALLLSRQQQSVQSRASGPEMSAIPAAVTATGSGYLAGYVYMDQNQNGEREQGEMPVPNAVIKVTQLNANGFNSSRQQAAQMMTQLHTDVNGYFKFQFSNLLPNSISYVVSLALPAGYKTIDTNPVLFTGLHQDAKKLVEFGIFPLPSLSLTPTCTPPPPCLNSVPRCLIPQPIGGWCQMSPSPTPQLTCIPRPACLDATPRCLIAEPASGWCAAISPTQ